MDFIPAFSQLTWLDIDPKIADLLTSFLGRSNNHGPNFHFATEYFECRPLLCSCSMDSSCNGYRYKTESRICDIIHYSHANNNSTVCRYALTPGRNLHSYSWYITMLNDWPTTNCNPLISWQHNSLSDLLTNRSSDWTTIVGLRWSSSDLPGLQISMIWVNVIICMI